MKILITGATGLVGQKLCAQLIGRGHSLIVVSRDAARARKKLQLNCEYISCDLTVGELDKGAWSSVGGLINLMGEPVAEGRWTEQKKKNIYDSRVLSAQNLIASLAQNGQKLDWALSASAIGFYPESSPSLNTPAWLEDDLSGDDFLAQTCVNWESAFQKIEGYAERSAILRIGIVLANPGGALDKILPPFKWGLGGPLGPGSQYMSWIHIDDLVNLFLFSVDNNCVGNNSAQGIFNAVANQPVTNQEFSQILGKVLRRPSFMRVPALAIKMLLGEKAQIVLRSHRVSNQKIRDLGYEFKYPELELALRDLLT